MSKTKNWKEWFRTSNKTHIVTLKPCPSCGIHYTPQPVSEKVAEKYMDSEFECDGCEAYQDHLK